MAKFKKRKRWQIPVIDFKTKKVNGVWREVVPGTNKVKRIYTPKLYKYTPSRPPLDLTGVSIDFLKEFVVNPAHLTKRDLYNIGRKLQGVLNKRMARLEKSGLQEFSYAYQKREGKRYAISMKMKRGTMMKMVSDMLRMAKSKSSTIKGEREILERIRQEVGEFDTSEQIKEFFDTYHRMLEELGIHPDSFSKEFYMGLRQKLYDVMYPDDGGERTPQDVMERMRDIVDQENAREEAKANEINENGFDLLEYEDEPFEVRTNYERIRIFDDDEEDDEE